MAFRVACGHRSPWGRSAGPGALAVVAMLLTSSSAQADLPVVRYSLDNGLRVVLVPLPTRAQVAVRIDYAAGGVDDPDGYPETSHLVEHLLFRGTRHTAGPVWRQFASFGVDTYNASTGAYATSFFAQGDGSQVERLLWIESERMAFGLDAITPSNVELERDLVWSEHGLRDGGAAELARDDGYAALLAALFPPGHPWRRMPPRVESRGRLTVDAARWYFQRWYAPGNARLTVAGGFDASVVREAVVRWFADIPDHALPSRGATVVAPPPPSVTEIASSSGPGAVLAGWIIPPVGDAGHAELDAFAAGLRRACQTPLVDPATGADITRRIDVIAAQLPTVSYLAIRAELLSGVSAVRARDALGARIDGALAGCEASDASSGAPGTQAPLVLSAHGDLLAATGVLRPLGQWLRPLAR